MRLALKISQPQEQSQKLQGPSRPDSLLQAPQKWEVTEWFFGWVPACMQLGEQRGWVDNPTPTLRPCPLPLMRAFEFNF